MANTDRNRVIVLAVVEGGMSVSEAARRFKVSRRWIHVLLARYQTGGEVALAPRSRAPHTSPHALPEPVRSQVAELRAALTSEGLDAGDGINP